MNEVGLTGGRLGRAGNVRLVLGTALLSVFPLSPVRAQPPADPRPWAQAERAATPRQDALTFAHGTQLAPRVQGNQVSGASPSVLQSDDVIRPTASVGRDGLSSEDRAMLRLHIRQQGEVIYKR